MQFAMNMCCIPDWWTMERSYGWAKCPLESVVEHWHLYVISNGVHQWLAQVLAWTTRYKQRNHWRVGHCWLLLLKQFQQDNRLWNVMRQQPPAKAWNHHAVLPITEVKQKKNTCQFFHLLVQEILKLSHIQYFIFLINLPLPLSEKGYFRYWYGDT